MSQDTGKPQHESSTTNGGFKSSVSVSKMTGTPWGDLVRRSSHTSVNLVKTKMFTANGEENCRNELKTASSTSKVTSPGPKAAAAGSKPTSQESKPLLPGPKPNLPGPKPSLPGPKPSLPGPKPSLLGPKPSLPGPKPNLPSSKPSSSGPKSSAGSKIVPGHTPTRHVPDSSNSEAKKPVREANSKQTPSPANPSADVKAKLVGDLQMSPRFPKRVSPTHLSTGSTPPLPSEKPSHPAPQSPRNGPPPPPVKPNTSSTSPPWEPPQPRSSSQPPEPPKKPSNMFHASSLGNVNRFQFPQKDSHAGQNNPKTLPVSIRKEAFEDLEKSQSLPHNLEGFASRQRTSAMEKASLDDIRSSICRNSRASSYVDDQKEGQEGDPVGETQRKSISYTSSDDSFEDVEESFPAVNAEKQETEQIIDTPTQGLSSQDTPTKPDLSPEELAEKNRRKRHDIAKELLETEEKYVSKLKLIAEDFYAVVVGINKPKVVIPDNVINQIFLNIKQIYQFNEELLRSLQQMLEKWDEKEDLGLTLSRLAPFLKLYSHYTSRFESAMETLTEYSKKEKKFDAALKEFEHSPACGHLGVAHHMLEPVQRIPRYRLLLLDYLKRLPEDSPDYEPSQKALEIISEAADRANNRIKELENVNEIQAIQRSLQDYEEVLLCPGRTFVKKGKLNKFSRKNTHQKIFFLFSDILIHANITSVGGFKCRDVMPVLGMKVVEPAISPEPHTFIVVSKTRSLTLAATSEEEKKDWIETLQKTISELKSKTLSLRKIDAMSLQESIDLDGFGVKAPVWVPDEHVSMCMLCCAQFTFTFRRHHCRACGKVICANCFKYKVYLVYKGKEDKVCSYCYDLAKASSGTVDSTDGPDEIPDAVEGPKTQQKTALDVHASGVNAVTAGYAMLNEGKKNWTKYWFQLNKDCVLYRFKAHEDVRALESIPLPGYKVIKDGDNIITLSHPHKPYKLKFEEEETDKWMQLLSETLLQFS